MFKVFQYQGTMRSWADWIPAAAAKFLIGGNERVNELELLQV